MPEPVPAMPGSSGVLELLPPGPMGLPNTWRRQWVRQGQWHPGARVPEVGLLLVPGSGRGC